MAENPSITQCEGHKQFQKRRKIFTWCFKRNPDIFLLQETHSTLRTETQWKNEWGAKLITSHGSCNSRGVAILMKYGIDCKIRRENIDPLGRFIILKADIKTNCMCSSIYMPQTRAEKL